MPPRREMLAGGRDGVDGRIGAQAVEHNRSVGEKGAGGHRAGELSATSDGDGSQ